MIIDKLELENFGKSTDKQTIEFQKGINLICGDNGEGKSNALKSLSLLLFNYSKGRHQDYINWDKDWFKTKLNLEHLSHKYEIDFSIGKGMDGKLLTIDNEDYYERSEANNKLAEIFSPKLCLASMISFEGETDLITVKPAERREHLKQIYDLDFKVEIARLKALISKLTDEDIAKVKENILLLEAIEYDVNDPPELPFTNDTYEAHKKLIASNNDRIKKAVELNSQRKQLSDQIDNLDLENDAERRTLQVIEANLLKARTELENFSSEIDPNLADDLASYINQLDGLNEDKIAEYEELKKLQKKQRPIRVTEAAKDERLSMKATLSSERSALAKKIENLKSGVCPTCNGEIDAKDISSWEKELKQLDESIDLVTEEILDLRTELDQKKVIEDFNLDVETKIDAYDRAIVDFRKDQKNLKERLEGDINNKKSQIASAIENISLKKDLLEKDVTNNEKELTNCDARKKAIIDSVKALEEQFSKLTEILVTPIETENAEIQGLITKFDTTAKEISLVEKKNVEEVLRQKDNEIKIIQFTDERNKLSSEVAEYAEQKDILMKKFPSYVIATLIKTIEYEMNDFIIKTYEGKYKIKIQEKKDAIYVVYGKKEADVSLASGYEKQVFSLAYKNALNKISGTGVLILDEVDSASSITNSLQLYKIVGSMTDLYQQIIIITHKPEVQELLIDEYNARAYEVKDGSFGRIA